MVIGEKEHVESIRQNVRDICKNFPNSYWRELDAVRGYPTDFVNELTRLGCANKPDHEEGRPVSRPPRIFS